MMAWRSAQGAGAPSARARARAALCRAACLACAAWLTGSPSHHGSRQQLTYRHVLSAAHCTLPVACAHTLSSMFLYLDVWLVLGGSGGVGGLGGCLPLEQMLAFAVLC